MNVPTPTKKPFFLIIAGIALLGIPLTLFALQTPQFLRQFAWSTQQNVTASCSTKTGKVVIAVSFTNTESTSSKDMDVVAKDLQTGAKVDLGTIPHQQTGTGIIETDQSSLSKGGVLFTLTWSNGAGGSDTRTASYGAVDTCPAPTDNFCPDDGANDQGLCNWDPLEGAEGYQVTVTETQSGKVVQDVSLPKDASRSAFPMVPGTAYKCSVTATNACGKSTPADSPEKICPGLPTPTPPICPSDAPPLGFCRWDAVTNAVEYNITVKNTKSGDVIKTGTVKAPDTEFAFPDNPDQTYVCSVTAVNECSKTPPTDSPPSTCNAPTPTPTITPTSSPTPTLTPTPTPTATPTPKPTATPTPLPTSTPMPTPTPVIIVRTVTTPPQIIQQPPQQTIVRQPGTQTVIQQPGTQTVVQQPGQQTVVQQQVPQGTTPQPTMAPTGSSTGTIFMVGVSTVLLLAGGLIFFIL